MNFLKTTNQDICQPTYLHFNNEKFWEIRIDKNSNKTIIRCGRLIDGEEEIFTVKAVEKTYDSRDEAMQAVERLTKIKFSKGYKNFKENGSNISTKSGFSTFENSRNENNIKEDLGTKRTAHELVGDIIKKQIKIESTQLVEPENSYEEQSFVPKRKTETNKNSVSARIPYSDSKNQTLIKDKASELGLKCSVEDVCVVVEGSEGQFEALQTYAELLTEKKDKNDSIKKIPMTIRIKNHIIAVEKKGKELGLVCTVGKDHILVMGGEGKIRTFKEYLTELEEGKGEKANKEDDPNEFIQQEISLSVNHKNKKPEIEKKLQDLGLFYEFSGEKLFALGARKTIVVLVEFLTDLDPKQKEKEKEKPPVEEKKQEIANKVVSDTNNNITDGQEIMMRKEIDMENIDDNRLRKIERKGEEEGIIVTVLRGKLAMLGLRTKMGEFLAYIETVKKDSDSGNNVNTKENNSAGTVNNADDYTQKELNISTFHRARKDELKAKARELDLICDFAYDIVLVSGSTANIYKFITLLYEIETEAKKSLYPKYWDFHDTRPFSKVEISKKSPEFKVVADKFLESLDEGFQIIRIERIQNRYLMEHYITNIQKKMELRSGKRVNRELLFHGTRNADPEIIYKSFDTGFDTQFAANGSCGTGLYFALNAAYSCEGYEHRTRQGTFQIFLADVFVGESADAEAGNGKKAPNGADSVFCEEFYVIYNNFHSYPLYLIEYSTEDADGWDGY